jgi:hypothetical protein
VTSPDIAGPSTENGRPFARSMEVFDTKDGNIVKLVDPDERKLSALEKLRLQIEKDARTCILVHACRQFVIIEPCLYLVVIKSLGIERIGIHSDDQKAAVPSIRHPQNGPNHAGQECRIRSVSAALELNSIGLIA